MVALWARGIELPTLQTLGYRSSQLAVVQIYLLTSKSKIGDRRPAENLCGCEAVFLYGKRTAVGGGRSKLVTKNKPDQENGEDTSYKASGKKKVKAVVVVL